MHILPDDVWLGSLCSAKPRCNKALLTAKYPPGHSVRHPMGCTGQLQVGSPPPPAAKDTSCCSGDFSLTSSQAVEAVWERAVCENDDCGQAALSEVAAQTRETGSATAVGRVDGRSPHTPASTDCPLSSPSPPDLVFQLFCNSSLATISRGCVERSVKVGKQ